MYIMLIAFRANQSGNFALIYLFIYFNSIAGTKPMKRKRKI